MQEELDKELARFTAMQQQPQPTASAGNDRLVLQLPCPRCAKQIRAPVNKSEVLEVEAITIVCGACRQRTAYHVTEEFKASLGPLPEAGGFETEQLVQMGFSEAKAKKALQRCGNSVEAALERLCNDDDDNDPGGGAAADDGTTTITTPGAAGAGSGANYPPYGGGGDQQCQQQ